MRGEKKKKTIFLLIPPHVKHGQSIKRLTRSKVCQRGGGKFDRNRREKGSFRMIHNPGVVIAR